MFSETSILSILLTRLHAECVVRAQRQQHGALPHLQKGPRCHTEEKFSAGYG